MEVRSSRLPLPITDPFQYYDDSSDEADSTDDDGSTEAVSSF